MERPKKEDYDFNDVFEAVRFANTIEGLKVEIDELCID